MTKPEFAIDEKLFRAVRRFFFKQERPSSAAFKLREKKNEQELSFDRASGREDHICVAEMKSKLKGSIVSVTVGVCYNLDLTVVDTSYDRSPFHTSVYSGIPGSVTDEAALGMARACVIEYKADQKEEREQR